MTVPPPIVSRGPVSRTTKRSPGANGRARARRIRPSRPSPVRRSLAATSTVPTWTRCAPRVGGTPPSTATNCTSIRSVRRHCSARQTTSPRATSVRSTPARFERDAAARLSDGSRSLVGLDPPDPDTPDPDPDDVDRIAEPQLATVEGAGDHGPGPTDGERPVDPEARSRPARRGHGRHHLVEGGPQPVQVAALQGGDLDDRPRGWDAGRNLGAHLGSAARLDGVDLRERDHDVAHLEQSQDRRMLLRLGHPTFVGRHDEQRTTHPADAREHVADEALVPGNVHEPDLDARRQHRPPVAEVDGQPTPLLLCEPVGITAGERLHERGLPVVHVTGRGDHLHGTSVTSRSGIDRIASRVPTPR